VRRAAGEQASIVTQRQDDLDVVVALGHDQGNVGPAALQDREPRERTDERGIACPLFSP
jgi:hypothetical protein